MYFKVPTKITKNKLETEKLSYIFLSNNSQTSGIMKDISVYDPLWDLSIIMKIVVIILIVSSTYVHMFM